MLRTPSKPTILLASAFLVGAAFWRWVVAPYLLMIPEDFTYSAEIESMDNFYNEETDAYNGSQYSDTGFSYQVMSSTEEGLEIQNLFSVQSREGTEFFSTQRIYGIDAKTGAHVQGLGDEDREGFLFAPKNLKRGEPYTYWHVNYNGPAEMNFVGEERPYDLKVYHYESYYEGVAIDQTTDLDHLPGVPEEKGVSLSPHLEVWVEPVTGYLVKYQDETTAYYYDIETGETLAPWNQFSNSYTEESVKEHTAAAYALKWKALFVQGYLPIIFVLLGLLIVVSGLWKTAPRKKGSINPLLTAFMMLTPLVGILCTWYLTIYNFRNYTELEFKERAGVVEDAIVERMGIYLTTLQGISGLFAASESVERDEWASYVEQLHLEEQYPGIGAVGFARAIKAEEQEAFVESVRAEDLSDYTLRPEGERESYAPILYLEPSGEGTSFMLGFDIYSEPTRSGGAIQARDSGAPSMSGKVELMTADGEENPNGFLVYLPVYKKGASYETIEERRAAIFGYIYAPFRMSTLMQGIFGDTDLGVSFEIYDGSTLDEAYFLYDSNEGGATLVEPSYSKTATIYLAGRPWTLLVESGQDLEPSLSEELFKYGTLLGGLLLASLYLFVYYALTVTRERSLSYIRKKL